MRKQLEGEADNERGGSEEREGERGEDSEYISVVCELKRNKIKIKR
jgi:hypothetical protein